MATRNRASSVYIGNLDEKVSERVLYEILIQVGPVDLHIPRDRETNRPKGYAFAKYESEEIANYAVRLFSGLVRLHNKTLRFAISGQDKSSQNSTNQPKNHIPLPSGPNTNSVNQQDTKLSQIAPRSQINGRVSSGADSQASTEGFVNNGLGNNNFQYSKRVLGAMLNGVTSREAGKPIAYPSY